MPKDEFIKIPNADVPHLKKNAHTGTFSWDEEA